MSPLDRPYSELDEEQAEQHGLDLDNWNDYASYYALGDDQEQIEA